MMIDRLPTNRFSNKYEFRYTGDNGVIIGMTCEHQQCSDVVGTFARFLRAVGFERETVDTYTNPYEELPFSRTYEDNER